MSLTWTWRLSMDSNRSPKSPTTARSKASQARPHEAHLGQGPAAQGDADDHRGGRAPHHPGPGLPRAHLRIELGLAPGPAGVECPGIPGHNHHHEPEDPPLPVAQVAQPDKVPQKQGDIEEAQDIGHQIPAQVGNVAVGDEVEEEEDKENPHQHEEGAAGVAQGGDPLGGAETQEEHRSQDNGFQAAEGVGIRAEHAQELPLGQPVHHQEQQDERDVPAPKEHHQQQRQDDQGGQPAACVQWSPPRGQSPNQLC